jgi:hypothetical protein
VSVRDVDFLTASDSFRKPFVPPCGFRTADTSRRINTGGEISTAFGKKLNKRVNKILRNKLIISVFFNTELI